MVDVFIIIDDNYINDVVLFLRRLSLRLTLSLVLCPALLVPLPPFSLYTIVFNNYNNFDDFYSSFPSRYFSTLEHF